METPGYTLFSEYAINFYHLSLQSANQEWIRLCDYEKNRYARVEKAIVDKITNPDVNDTVKTIG